MVDSEENYKFDLGVKGLKLKIYNDISDAKSSFTTNTNNSFGN